MDQIPNLLTALRIAMTPLVAWAIAVGSWRLAGLLFVIAAVTDALDGWLARRLDARSPLGERLDPIADKALINAAMLGCALSALLPWWLALLMLARDGMILTGAVLTHTRRLGHSLLPLWIGKAATAGQMSLIATALAAHAWPQVPPLVSEILVWPVALLTLASGAAYLGHWVRRHPAYPRPT